MSRFVVTDQAGCLVAFYAGMQDVPDGAREITHEQHVAWLDAMNAGQEWRWPSNAPAPAPYTLSQSEIAAATEVKKRRSIAFQMGVDPSDTKAVLKAYAAAARYAREVGGIVIGGETVRTDRESQALIANARALADVEPNEPVAFKAAGAWIEMDSAAVHIIALEVGRHVRGCFRTERELDGAIEAGSVTTTAQIDEAFQA